MAFFPCENNVKYDQYQLLGQQTLVRTAYDYNVSLSDDLSKYKYILVAFYPLHAGEWVYQPYDFDFGPRFIGIILFTSYNNFIGTKDFAGDCTLPIQYDNNNYYHSIRYVDDTHITYHGGYVSSYKTVYFYGVG